MKWFLGLFKKTSPEIPKKISEGSNRWYQGFYSFEKGEKLFFNKQYIEALKSFDLAINYGFEADGIYHLRGQCLLQLKYYLDSIEDFDKAISYSPEDFKIYFNRSISKGGIRDYSGQIEDLKKALELSKKDNAINRAYEAHQNKWLSEADMLIRGRLIIFESNIDGSLRLEKVFCEMELNPTPERHLTLEVIQKRKDAFKRREA